MTEPQMRELVMGTFAAAWSVQAPSVPLVLENEAFPSGFTSLCMLTVTPTVSTQMTMGRAPFRRIRRQGWIQAKLWAPPDVGSRDLAALGDIVQDILEFRSLPSPLPEDDPITILGAQAGASGASTDGKFYLALVRLPFWYTETR